MDIRTTLYTLTIIGVSVVRAEELSTRIPSITGQDEAVEGNFANWGTTTIETGLVINNNNGGTVSGPALQVASFTANPALLVTTTAGSSVVQVSTNPGSPALSVANNAGTFLANSQAGGVVINGNSGSNALLTTAGSLTAPAIGVGSSSVGISSPATNELALAQGGAARLMLDTTGSVYGYSLYKVHAYAAGGQSLAAGTTTLSFANESYDLNNNFNSGTTYTAPVTGYYMVMVQVCYTVSAAADTYYARTINLADNGTVITGYAASAEPSIYPTVLGGLVTLTINGGTGPYALNLMTIVPLTQGNQLTVQWDNTSGAADTVVSPGTHLTIHLISV